MSERPTVAQMHPPQTVRAEKEAETPLDLHFYWTVVKKRKWVILATALIVLAAAVGWAARKPRIYQSASTMIIDPQAPNTLGNNIQDVVDIGAGNYWSNADYYNTQYAIITSRMLGRQVAARLTEEQKTYLLPQPDPTWSEEELNDKLATRIITRIRVKPAKDSRVAAIAVRDSNPVLARDLANLVRDTYIEFNGKSRGGRTGEVTKYVAEKLDDAKKTLESNETALYDYKRENNILSVSLEDRQNMVAKSLEDFNSSLTHARAKRIDLETRRASIARMMQSDITATPSTHVTQAETIAAIRKTYLDEKRKLEGLAERYGPKWPGVVEQQKIVDGALADLQTEARTLLASIDAEIKALRDAEARYQAELERLTQEALAMNERSIQYKKLQREADNAEQVYGVLHKRLNESGLQQDDPMNNIRPLDEARIPSAPIEPNLKQAAIFGLAMGLILALGLAFFVEFLDRSVKSQEDIEATVGLSFLGFVPSVEDSQPTAGTTGGRDLHILKHPNGSAAECCRVVRTNILFCSPDKPLKTLMVTSSNPVEGKTMTVVNLGVVMAQGGARTLLVDTDMRRPRLHKALGVGNDNGVSRLILGETDIEDAVKSTEVPNLYVLPCGPPPPNPAELLQTEKFAALVRRLVEKYDRVIFDSPPVNAVTDAAVLSRLVDGSVMVVRAGRTSRDAVVRAKSLLKAVKANIIGAVLNDVDLKNPHYASYYHYYQYKYVDGASTAADEG